MRDAPLALHILWSTFGVRLPQEDEGAWPGLRVLYEKLKGDGGQTLSSDPLRHSASRSPLARLALSEEETRAVDRYLRELAENDRIAAGLPILALAVLPIGVHLLTGEPPGPLSQVVGRMKSKTASSLLWSPSRRGLPHIWSSGFWRAELLDESSVEQVRGYILAPRPEDGSAKP